MHASSDEHHGPWDSRDGCCRCRDVRPLAVVEIFDSIELANKLNAMVGLGEELVALFDERRIDSCLNAQTESGQVVVNVMRDRKSVV